MRLEESGERDLEDPTDFTRLRIECRTLVGDPNHRMEGKIADRDVQRGQDAEDPDLIGVDPDLLRSLAERGLRDRFIVFDPATRERHLSGMQRQLFGTDRKKDVGCVVKRMWGVS